MVFGTPGGDSQDQWTLQFFLNHVDFGMDLQEALDAAIGAFVALPVIVLPAVIATRRGSWPRIAFRRACSTNCGRRGHDVVTTGGWTNGKVMGNPLP